MTQTHFGGCIHLECTKTGDRYDCDRLQTISDVGAPLYARYDLTWISRKLRRSMLSARSADLWRYAELLPVCNPQCAIRLGEGLTPLLQAQRLARALELDLDLWIKDEGQNPTASFKARGMALAVSRAFELGVRALALPSAGNAASAASAYAAACGIECHVVMPKNTPKPIVCECEALGANLQLVDGLITDCAKVVAQGCAEQGWFDLSTLKEPYRVEGKKTMGLELAEQFDWVLPDVIVYPTGGGTGMVGMWKAFEEMEQLGWIDSNRPKMVAVQSTGCAPIVRAFEENAACAQAWKDAQTIASGLCVPSAIGDFLILQAVRESGGVAIGVADSQIVSMVNVIGKNTGVFPAPEAAATVACLPALCDQGVIQKGDRVLLFFTGSGLKYCS